MTSLAAFGMYFLGFMCVFIMRDKIADDDYIPEYIIFWIFSPIAVPVTIMGYYAYLFYKKFIKRLFV